MGTQWHNVIYVFDGLGLQGCNLRHSLALATVMGGQQVCIQTFRPCNDGGVIVTTQYQIFFFFPRKVDLARN